MEEKKYYFISYRKAIYGDLDSICIDLHPLLYGAYNVEIVILFWKEISKEEYCFYNMSPSAAMEKIQKIDCFITETRR